MIIEKEVVSQSLAKRLKKLGYPQKSSFYWTKRADQWHLCVLNEGKLFDPWNTDLTFSGVYYAAYSARELQALLPEVEIFFCVQKGTHVEEADTEADALAKMAVYLEEYDET